MNGATAPRVVGRISRLSFIDLRHIEDSVMKFVLMVTLLLLPAMFHSGNAYAGFVISDDVVFGTGSITLDTDTSLEWLDVTLSTNRTFEYVSSQFGTTGEFAGFRHATNSEIARFWLDAGIPDIGSSTFANIVPAQSLMDYIGSASFQDGIGDGRQALAIGAGGYRSDLDGVVGPKMIAIVGAFQWTNRSAATVGHWLVRDDVSAASVPEPTSVAMWGIGVLGMMFAGHKRKHTKPEA